jgi:GH24 family phage-related lysozyme (muramidase)
MTPKPIRLVDLFKYYRALPHQNAALQELEAQILKADPNVFNRSQDWYSTWSSAVAPKEFGPAAQMIKEFEGCRLTAYLCPAGVPTIGFGNTRYPDGAPVKMGDSISQQRADQMLSLEIEHTVDILKKSIPYWNEMNVNQQSALISFAFNLGAYFYRSNGFGTISRALASKAWDQVPDALLLYRNPGSSFEAGLKRRRIAEGNLWMKAA